MNGKATAIALQAGTPCIIWGPPGTGKTSWVKDIAQKLNLPVEIVIASIREPSDFAGLPVIQDDGTVNLAPPGWAERLAAAGEGILFLDELSTAPPAVQSAALRVVNERVVGDLELPPSIYILAAANPTDTSSGTWILSAALANRFVHLNWGIRTESWVDGMLSGWENLSKVQRLPQDWQDNIPHWKGLMASFIKANPTRLLNEPKNAEDAGGPWPSPRTWEMASILLSAANSIEASEETQISLMCGCIGEGAGAEFMVWVKDLDLPDPLWLLKNPKEFEVPQRSDQIFAVLTAVVTHAKENLNANNWKAAWMIVGKTAKEGYADISALPARSLARAHKNNKRLSVPKDIIELLPILQAAGLV